MDVHSHAKNYWDVDSNDVRLVLLKRFLETVDESILEFQSTDQIIQKCIEALKKFIIASDEMQAFRKVILKQNTFVLNGCLKHIREEIIALGAKQISLISLGSGNESVFERAISEDMAINSPNIELEWLGVDIGDYRDETSFLWDKAFVAIDQHTSINYRSLIQTSDPVILIGRWSYHHIGISFDEFLDRCTGLSKVILLEEPTIGELWNRADYRVMRIAYDVLGNLCMSESWAAEFMNDPGKFKIQYVLEENLPPQSKVIHFAKSLPETALLLI
jgi:hypothetical protein